MGKAGGNPQGEIEWGTITFSDANVIRGLIRCRYKFDKLYLRQSNGAMESNTDLNEMKQEVHLTYIALDELIGKTKLNEKQQTVLDMFMEGWTEEEIGIELDNAREAIFLYITRICESIANENLRRWRKIVYTKKLDLKTKQCSECKEHLPAVNEFFINDKGGFRNRCKKCSLK